MCTLRNILKYLLLCKTKDARSVWWTSIYANRNCRTARWQATNGQMIHTHSQIPCLPLSKATTMWMSVQPCLTADTNILALVACSQWQRQKGSSQSRWWLILIDMVDSLTGYWENRDYRMELGMCGLRGLKLMHCDKIRPKNSPWCDCTLQGDLRTIKTNFAKDWAAMHGKAIHSQFFLKTKPNLSAIAHCDDCNCVFSLQLVPSYSVSQWGLHLWFWHAGTAKGF